MFRTILFYITLSIWFVLWAPFLLLALPSRAMSRRFIVWDAWGVAEIARLVAGIKYELHYPAPTDKYIRVATKTHHTRADGRAIIASKHMSVLEAAVYTINIPNAFFIIKRELLWIPIYGWSFARIGLVGVNRARGATDLRKLSDIVADKIVNKMNLIIFPEGTRTRPGQKIKLKRGLLFLAETLKLPIQPVGTDGGKYWPRRGRMHAGTANFWFGEMLPYNATIDEISDAINVNQ